MKEHQTWSYHITAWIRTANNGRKQVYGWRKIILKTLQVKLRNQPWAVTHSTHNLTFTNTVSENEEFCFMLNLNSANCHREERGRVGAVICLHSGIMVHISVSLSEAVKVLHSAIHMKWQKQLCHERKRRARERSSNPDSVLVSAQIMVWNECECVRAQHHPTVTSIHPPAETHSHTHWFMYIL